MVTTDWVTFDCFGTLIDWRHGLAASADLLFPGRGADVLERYNVHELDVERQTPTMRYRDVMAESLRRAAGDLGLELLDDDAIDPRRDDPVLAGIPATWPPSSARCGPAGGAWRCSRTAIATSSARRSAGSGS